MSLFLYLDSADLYCAKAQRQQQSLLCESAATATNVFVPKVKRQVQNTSTPIGGEMIVVIFLLSVCINAR